MRLNLTPIEENTRAEVRRFALLPRRVGWVWVWLETYSEHWLYDDIDDDGRYEWRLLAVSVGGHQALPSPPSHRLRFAVAAALLTCAFLGLSHRQQFAAHSSTQAPAEQVRGVAAHDPHRAGRGTPP